jgi:hypothetical protein
MKVKELIEQLQKVDQEANVFLGYDGNIVITEPVSVQQIGTNDQIPVCWWRAGIGDVVILNDGT